MTPYLIRQAQATPLIPEIDWDNFGSLEPEPNTSVPVGLVMANMDLPAPLLRLPPELTERIATFLRVSDPDSDAGEESSEETDTATTTSTSEMSMCDFCASRLTCKDVYLKTFRLFSRYYFTTISVGFTHASLDRLCSLANYRNSFGLTLFEFPSHLIVSTLRLLPETEVDRIFSISDPQEDAQAVVATITLLCELGIESYNVPGAFNPDVYAIAGKYRKAVASQQSLTTSSCDINKIARAIATFPKFRSITLDAYDNSWGEEDWQEIAGFDRKVFTSFGDIQSGQNNLEFAFNRVPPGHCPGRNNLSSQRTSLESFLVERKRLLWQ